MGWHGCRDKNMEILGGIDDTISVMDDDAVQKSANNRFMGQCFKATTHNYFIPW